jgi:ketosteroid isomerase-like protein
MRNMFHIRPFFLLILMAGVAAPTPVAAQTSNPSPAVQPLPPGSNPMAGGHKLVPLATPNLSPQALELLKLEDQFEQDVAKGGGKAFASWFAPDGVTLNNGQPAVRGQQAIASTATWDPKSYQLQWYVEGAQMGPSGDTGFTWGHYESRSQDKDGHPVTTAGRYITFWKKMEGAWKVALDASASDAP